MSYTVTLDTLPQFLDLIQKKLLVDKQLEIDITPKKIVYLEDTDEYKSDCDMVDAWRKEHPNHREYIWEWMSKNPNRFSHLVTHSSKWK
jgi:hypothetical protein